MIILFAGGVFAMDGSAADGMNWMRRWIIMSRRQKSRLCTRQSEPVSLVGLFSLNNFYFCHSDSSISHQRYILLSVVLCVFVPQGIEYPTVGFILALRSLERFLVLEPPLK